jgi:hypothetical protein
MRQVLYHVTEKSTNRKTGPISVITSSRNSCPDVCPFKDNGCYADGGPIRIHWEKINCGERGITFNELLSKLRNLAVKFRKKSDKKLKIRLWQAGDMPGINNRINSRQTKQLVKVLQDFDEPFGYTHKPLDIGNNSELIKFCNDNGVTINLSANNLFHTDYLADQNIGPISVTLNAGSPKSVFTPAGRKVLVCPAVLTDKITCATCGGSEGALCWRNNRNYIIGFPAHGFKIKKVSEIANGTKIKC